MSLGAATNNNTLNEAKKTDQIKPLYETGSLESCNSLAWNPHNMHQLLASVNGKTLKIFDVRVNAKATASVATKYAYGFSIDPGPNAAQHQAASFYEKEIAIWDVRMFDRPIHQITETDVICKIQWCPTK